MTKCKTIDLTRPAELQFDEETASFQPSWKNTILMTAYGKERTLVLARDGRCLLLPQPLQKVLDQFASDNGIADYERQALYDWIGVHKGRGYIAGDNRLVPTHGTTNPAVVYYMAYYLYHTYEAGGRVIASFHGRKKRNFQVIIDTGYKTFVRLLQAADDAAKLQLDILAWQMHSYGVKKVHKRQSVRFYDMCSTKRLMCQDLRKRWMLEFCHQVIPDYCTPEECKEIEERVRRYIEK